MVGREGFDNFVGNKIGRSQSARRVRAMEGAHQPSNNSLIFNPLAV
jgi:hypothetical protein